MWPEIQAWKKQNNPETTNPGSIPGSTIAIGKYDCRALSWVGSVQRHHVCRTYLWLDAVWRLTCKDRILLLKQLQMKSLDITFCRIVVDSFPGSIPCRKVPEKGLLLLRQWLTLTAQNGASETIVYGLQRMSNCCQDGRRRWSSSYVIAFWTLMVLL